MDNLPFDIDDMLRRVEEAVRPFPKAALFKLAEVGYRTPFEQLAACIISIRTLDEVTVVTAQRLFERARSAADVARFGVANLDAAIHGCAFRTAKARQIHAIAERLVAEHGGEPPCDFGELTALGGVGPKCANLVLGIACGPDRMAGVAVDIHVHRITNRWGYVDAPTPAATMRALGVVLPRRHWLDINRLLVPFGKHICTGKAPHCSTCPVLAYCRQEGITAHR